ncbi:MAG TPA: DNA translocase FtsK 4TM domain-containing protein, partial [Anaerolineae bacterium]
MARRRTKAKGKNGWSLQTWLRPDTIGAILVVLALLMLLSLLTSNRSSLVGSLVAELRVLFGIGIWLVPLVIGALGFWLVLRQIADQEVLSGRRIVAAVAFFLAFEALAHLILLGAEVDPRAVSTGSAGGGVLGWAIVQMLAGILDVPGTVLALVVLLVAALLGLSGLTFGQIQEWLAESLDRLRGRGRDDGTFAPPLPFGEPVSRWRRGWQRLFPPRTPPLPPPVFGRPPAPRLDQPVTPRQIGQSPHINLPGTSAAGPVTTTPPVRTNPAPTAAGSAAAGAGTVTRDVSPRLGGSGQSWRLPVTGEVLEDVSEYDIKSEDLRQRAQIIEKTLDGFGVPVQVVEINPGPAVTQFGLRPGIIVRKNRKGEEKRIKVRVSQIQALSNDLALALAASPLRIEAPVPGKDVVGVEVPNVQVSMVSLRGVMESEEFRVSRGPLIFGLGRDVSGAAAIADLARMPHLLIAGATGSGKSVCVNAIITTLLLTHTPESLRFLMIDPKRVELTVYNGIPHLIAPVVVDVERAVPVLQWATKEMER